MNVSDVDSTYKCIHTYTLYAYIDFVYKHLC